MKKILNTMLVTSFILFCMSVPISAQEELYAQTYHVDMEVKEDGKILITETINMHFISEHHGIYVIIPVWQTMDGVNYYWPVTDINVYGDVDYDIENDISEVTIKLGSADYYAPEFMEYKISYVVNTTDYSQDNVQYLYYNIIGKYHDYGIESSSFTITFPKDLPQEPNFLAPNPDYLQVTKAGNTYSGSYNYPLNYEGITIASELGENYFVFSNGINPLYLLIVSGIIGVLAIVYGLVRKDKQIIVDSIQFEAPDGLNSAEVGYLFDDTLKYEEMISLLVYWASKGKLKFEEINKKNMKITKMQGLDDTATPAEVILFEAMFDSNDDTVVETTTKQLVKKKELTSALPLSIDMTQKRFAHTDKVYDKSGNALRFILLAITPFIVVLPLFVLTYNFFLTIGLSVIFGMIIPYILLVIVTILTVNLLIKRRRQSMLVLGAISIYIISSIIFSGLFIIFFRNNPFMNIGIFFIVYSVFYLSVVMLSYPNKLTPYGIEIKGKIQGLYNFINTAEKDRLEVLVNDNPSFFYDILPYAYVLGITDVWIKQFESIAVPAASWYVGPNNSTLTNIYVWNSLNNQLNHVRSGVASNMVTSSGSGSGFGSGSFTGGGSSGGGFGGSGGGGW